MKIGIIGSGISGLGAAYLLHREHDITLFEKNDYIGGHSRTVEVSTPEGTMPVDTGFIVFNYRNYPLLTALFAHIDVPVMKSDMSFGASIADGWLEYSTQTLRSLFAQPRNLTRPAFHGMVRDILRFNRRSLDYLDAPPEVTLGQFLDELGMGEWFRRYFLLAVGGAIWSTPLSQMLNFPARTFIRFFDNHGLLTVNDQPQWYTVKGGSREYVTRLTAPFADRINTGCGAARVSRLAEGVEVIDTQGEQHHFDQVIFACHADQALHILQTPTREESKLLGACGYQPNEMVLHSDLNLMPKNRTTWASWVYLSQSKDTTAGKVSLSYWMNRLQSLETEAPLIVTLNPGHAIDPALVHDRYNFEHPIFDTAAIQAQEAMDNIQGTDRLWYCGAYHRYGFHEDGFASGVGVAQKLGATLPWA